MAGKVSVVLEAVGAGLTGGLAKAREEINAFAATASEKLEATKKEMLAVSDSSTSAAGGIGGALGSISGYIAPAVGALGAFALHAVDKFAQAGDAVYKFSEVTGMSAQASSRWVAVMGQLGVQADSASTVLGKFEKTIAAHPKVLEEYGIATARAADGTVDMNQTLLNAIDVFSNTSDSTQKAAMGAALFGKSWQQILPVLDAGSGAVSDLMGQVSGGLVFTEKSAQQAHELQIAQEQLKQAVAGLEIEIGRNLAPVLLDFIKNTKTAGDSTKSLGDRMDALANSSSFGAFGRQVGWLKSIAEDALPGVGKLFENTKKVGDSAIFTGSTIRSLGIDEKVAADSTAGLADAYRVYDDLLTAGAKNQAAASAANTAAIAAEQKAQADLAKSITDVRKARDADLKGAFDSKKASLDLADALVSVDAKYRAMADSAAKAKGIHDQTSKAVQDAAQASRDFTRALIDYADKATAALGPSASAAEQYLAQVNALNSYAAAEPKAAAAVADLIAQLNKLPIAAQLAAADLSNLAAIQGGGKTTIRAKASGGPVAPGMDYLVGERGPEIIRMGGRPGNVIPTDKIGGAMGGTSIVVNATTNASAGDIASQVAWQLRTLV